MEQTQIFVIKHFVMSIIYCLIAFDSTLVIFVTQSVRLLFKIINICPLTPQLSTNTKPQKLRLFFSTK